MIGNGRFCKQICGSKGGYTLCRGCPCSLCVEGDHKDVPTLIKELIYAASAKT